MDSKERQTKLGRIRADMNETAVRIRRYTVDPRLADGYEGRHRLPPLTVERVRKSTDEAWVKWLGAHVKLEAVCAAPTDQGVGDCEKEYLEIDRAVDLIQRELISKEIIESGLRTVRWLLTAMAILAGSYIFLHVAHPPLFDSWDFEPWAEWGPMKYAEVVYWGMFGCVCYLVFTAATYLLRRDFDAWYQAWYVAVFMRSPFVTLILMMIVLEFTEWYGDDKAWLRNTVLEEGNKFYFIVFMSFCLGLASARASDIIGDLSNGVAEMVSRAVTRVSKKLGSAVADPSTPTEH